ncbi:hypothetical protein EB74_15270 [Mycobacterium sp. SWH-M5]|nr:hypothetical protein EB74_15270 [Mycobacterium sp. SWH-M5]
MHLHHRPHQLPHPWEQQADRPPATASSQAPLVEESVEVPTGPPHLGHLRLGVAPQVLAQPSRQVHLLLERPVLEVRQHRVVRQDLLLAVQPRVAVSWAVHRAAVTA